jgi:uncharacterized protein
MIDLDRKYLDAVITILGNHVPDCEVRVFGSRVTGTARPFSDLDLVLVGKEKLDPQRLEALRNAFSESDLPIMVDVLDWHTLSEEFRGITETRYVIIQKPGAEADHPAISQQDQLPDGNKSPEQIR